MALLGVIGLLVAGLLGVDRLLEPLQFGRDMQRFHNRTFTCSHVVDGDTLDVRDQTGRPVRIRLWGVDTPETVKENTPVQHFGPEASRFTETACLDKPLRLELVAGRTRDKYDRVLAYVYLADGTMLNRQLIVGGLAYADPLYRHPYRDEFLRFQKNARAERVGLWAELTPADLPWYYRHGKHALKLPAPLSQPARR